MQTKSNYSSRVAAVRSSCYTLYVTVYDEAFTRSSSSWFFYIDRDAVVIQINKHRLFQLYIFWPYKWYCSSQMYTLLSRIR